MKKLISAIGFLMATTGANALELVHPENTVSDEVEVTLDCFAYQSSAWIAIYDSEGKLSQYGSSQKDWFYLSQAEDCVFAFAPREKEGTYVVRLFETSSYDKADEEMTVEITAGAGRPKAAPPAIAAIDNDNFWVSVPAAQMQADMDIKVGINCHDMYQTYTGRGLLIQLAPSGHDPAGAVSGKFQQDWYWLKNFQQGDPCYYEFAGRPAGNYEILVFEQDEMHVRARVPFTIAASQSGGTVKQAFDINKIEKVVEQWNPVRGNNNCINALDRSTVENRCRKPVAVTILKLRNGVEYAPAMTMTIESGNQQPLDFKAEFSMGWLACMLDDEDCMKAQSCLADIQANPDANTYFEIESHCNFSGKYVPI
ncbi:MAG: hypothetical protein KTR32_10320 [Granulosicoccus sp.]|nr:hypothetical protein [Granulosicoccus sp.]